MGTENKQLVIGCESGEVISAHVAKRAEIFHKQFGSPCNACIVVKQTVVVGCADGKVSKVILPFILSM